MLKYNIDNGKTAVVDKIKHHEKHNQAKNIHIKKLTLRATETMLYTYYIRLRLARFLCGS